MLPFFIEHDYVDTEYFFVWDLHQWYKAPAPVVEARKANGKGEPPRPHNQALDVNELCKAMEVVGIPTVVIQDPTDIDPPLVPYTKEAPQPSPTKTYRRF
jgi:hypothetical protein